MASYFFFYASAYKNFIYNLSIFGDEFDYECYYGSARDRNQKFRKKGEEVAFQRFYHFVQQQ